MILNVPNCQMIDVSPVRSHQKLIFSLASFVRGKLLLPASGLNSQVSNDDTEPHTESMNTLIGKQEGNIF